MPSNLRKILGITPKPEDALSSDDVIRSLAVGDMTPETYITNRIAAGIATYRLAGDAARLRYLVMRCAAVVGGAAVPVLINVTFPFHGYVTTGLSLMVGVLVAIEGVLHYKEQWKDYTYAASKLEGEFFALKGGIGPYADNAEPFTEFVQRSEDVISSELVDVLNVMATGPDVNALQAQKAVDK